MTTCSSSSDNPDSTSTSDVEDFVDHAKTDEISREHDLECLEVGNTLKTSATSHCDYDDLTASSLVTHFSDSMQITKMEPGNNGVLSEVSTKSEQMCNTSSSFVENADSKVCDSVITCLANGLLSEIPLTSTVNFVASSEVKSSSFSDSCCEFKDILLQGNVVTKPDSSTAHCRSHTVNSELKPSLVNSIPLLSIPHTEHICNDDSSFSILPSLSPSTTEGATAAVQVIPPSIFSVPCEGKGSDSFTDVSLDNDIEAPRMVSTDTLNVPRAVSTESSRDSSPSRLQLAASLSNLQLDDAIVQSVLYDDEDDGDSSHAIGNSRHSTPAAFSTNTDSAAFRTPGSTSNIPLSDDGLHVVEPDSASFEEISLQSSSASVEFRNQISPEQSPASTSKSTSVANFFAR